ncbi:MAG: xanthine dehydrogenase family protein subunit M [Pseudomonadota bacterium]|nr:xanthine dehydrogenase family protein subunit M [Pseudomonadota bacterium]
MKLHHPRTVDQVVALLAEDQDARCLAGGATLVAMMNADLLAPTALVSLRDVETLKGISLTSDGTAVIGAMTNHVTLAETNDFDKGQRIVAEAASVIGHPAIRNMGTIGGAIAHADSAADYPAALVAAEAVIRTAGGQGERDIPAGEFFVDYLETALQEGEMVSSVLIPPAPDGAVAYEKFARVEGDFATVSVAVVLKERQGNIDYIRLAVGACAPTPIRSIEVENMLRVDGISDQTIALASEKIIAAADPVDDFRGTAEYRLNLIPVLITRALARARNSQKGEV